MSAINFVKQANELHFFTDAGSYLPDGTIVGFASKLHALPHLPAVLTARGPGLSGPIFANEFGRRAVSFDALIDNIEALFEQLHDQYRDLITAFEQATELIIGGWSERRRAMAVYHISSASKKDLLKTEQLADGMVPMTPDPFELVELKGDITMAPHIGPGDLEKAFGDLFQNFASVDDLPPLEIFARTVMELQRERQWQMFHDQPAAHFIGGFIQLTTVTPREITSRVIHRWSEDRAGAAITPTPIDWAAWRAQHIESRTPAMKPAGMSRLERDMLERKTRKQARARRLATGAQPRTMQ